MHAVGCSLSTSNARQKVRTRGAWQGDHGRSFGRVDLQSRGCCQQHSPSFLREGAFCFCIVLFMDSAESIAVSLPCHSKSLGLELRASPKEVERRAFEWSEDIVNRCPFLCDSTHDLSVTSKTRERYAKIHSSITKDNRFVV